MFIPDPGPKGSKKHRISDPDPQHWLLGPSLIFYIFLLAPVGAEEGPVVRVYLTGATLIKGQRKDYQSVI